MIELLAASARDTSPSPSPFGGPHTRTPRVLSPLTLTLGAGMHALVGSVEDGVALVLAVLAGRVRPSRGRAVVLGGAPDAPKSRCEVAHVPLDAVMPDPLRVDEALAMAAEIRGEPPQDSRARLDVLGLAPLAARRVKTLSIHEVRAVALAEAVTSRARVLLLEEPYVLIDPRAACRLANVLHARARDGACVLIATASVRDAADLAEDHLIFERGVLVRRTTAALGLAARGSRGARLRVTTSNPRALLAALATDPAVTSLESSEGILGVGGVDPVLVASAIAAAALRVDAEIFSLRPDALALEELRASMAGDAAGAYRRAFEEGRSTATAQPPPFSPSAAQPPPETP